MGSDTLGLRSKRAEQAAVINKIMEAATPIIEHASEVFAPAVAIDDEAEPPLPIPLDWRKGQLLNVRNLGEFYAVTLLGEEFDVRHPERSLKFTNVAECQGFVSAWYSRESFDPRAY